MEKVKNYFEDLESEDETLVLLIRTEPHVKFSQFNEHILRNEDPYDSRTSYCVRLNNLQFKQFVKENIDDVMSIQNYSVEPPVELLSDEQIQKKMNLRFGFNKDN